MQTAELAGHLLMIGIPEAEMTASSADLFRQTHAGGLIVFRANFSSASVFKELLSGLEQTLGRKLLVAVDHEGGRVIHLREGITVFPDNWALGNTQNPGYAKRQGEIEALELRRLGIDLNLAPTVDVLTETFSPNIGIRSYGKDAEKVSEFAVSRIKAMQSGGLSACAKHFPGQGQSPLDAHLGLPVLPTTWDEMRRTHLKPFIAAIKAGVDTVMSSHPVYPQLDPAGIPATFSRKLIYDLLRRELGFEGVILSDDLEMGALKNICSIGESAVRAIEAGHDMVLICHEREAVVECHEALVRAIEEKRLNRRELEASAARIEKLKAKRKMRFSEEKVYAEPDGAKLAQKIAEEGLRETGSFQGGGKPQIFFPQLSSLAGRVHIENEMLNDAEFIAHIFQEQGMEAGEVHIVSLSPSADEMSAAGRKLKNDCPVIFFCYDAHLDVSTRRLLELFQEKNRQLAVVLLRNPYDAALVREKAYCVTAFGFRAAQIRAAVKRIAHVANTETTARVLGLGRD